MPLLLGWRPSLVCSSFFLFKWQSNSFKIFRGDVQDFEAVTYLDDRCLGGWRRIVSVALFDVARDRVGGLGGMFLAMTK